MDGSKHYATRDKTMTDKFMFIPNDDTLNYPFFRLKLVVETFGHLTLLTNQSKFTKVVKSPKL